jgi:hypothetical protein
MHIFGHWEYRARAARHRVHDALCGVHQDLVNTRTEHKSGARFDADLGGSAA